MLRKPAACWFVVKTYCSNSAASPRPRRRRINGGARLCREGRGSRRAKSVEASAQRELRPLEYLLSTAAQLGPTERIVRRSLPAKKAGKCDDFVDHGQIGVKMGMFG